MKRPIYLDYHATTPVDPRVAAVVCRHFTESYGNASSVDHVFGDQAELAVAAARGYVAGLVGALPEDVVFTSGATESINLALTGFANRFERVSGRLANVAISAVEHRAVLETGRALAKTGRITLTMLPVGSDGQIDLDALLQAARKGLDLICVMAANNEVGTLYPLIDIGRIATSFGAAFLCDATQAAGKVPLSIRDAGITFLALSAHKIYGPMGIGALVMTRPSSIDPIWFGGGQQRGIRPGTINVPGAVGLGEACRLRESEMRTDEAIIATLRDKLQAQLLEMIDGLVINGCQSSRLAGNLHISIPGVPNGAVIAHVRNELAIATGAACTSGIEAPSHVLQAMRLPRDVQEAALRIGLGKYTTSTEIGVAADLLSDAVHSIRHATLA